MAKIPEKPPISPLESGQWVQPGISEIQYRLIGRAIVSWAWLEAAMQDVLWTLVGVPIEDGRILTQRTDATRKIQWIRAFASRHLLGAEKTEMTSVLEDIEILQGDRNFIAHGSWATLMPDGLPMASSVREKSDQPDKIVSETFSQQRMVTIIQRIDAAKLKLARWRDKHEASRGKPPPQPTNA
jgi:hypothetical protein